MEKYSGCCSCGDVRYHITDEPMFTHACHCKHCQRYTASAFVVHSRIESSIFVLDTGSLITTVGPSGSGSGHSIKRCEKCGDQIYSHFGALGTDQLLVLKTTTLDEADCFHPLRTYLLKVNFLGLYLEQIFPCLKRLTRLTKCIPREV